MQASEIKWHANEIRKNIIQMISEAKSGHPGGSLSSTDILAVLYFDIMNIHADNITSKDRDRFVLSKGHAAPALYATLAQAGLLAKEELKTYRKINTNLQGHPNKNEVTGVDMSTGSLGQGMSCAIGMALANKIDKNSNHVYALVGDGECEEGQIWEAAMAAAHYHLDNLTVIVDYNQLQIDGAIQNVMNPTPIDEKFKAFGWHVLEVDGHDVQALQEVLHKEKRVMGKPTMILAHTIKGKGVSFMEHSAKWHGTPPSAEQCIDALKELEVC